MTRRRPIIATGLLGIGVAGLIGSIASGGDLCFQRRSKREPERDIQ